MPDDDYYLEEGLYLLARTPTNRADVFTEFLYMLPLTMRLSWAKLQIELLATQSARILPYLKFPTYKDPLSNDPPFGLRPVVYLEHLGHWGKKVLYSDDGYVKEGTLGDAEPETLQRIAHFQSLRIYQAGMGRTE